VPVIIGIETKKMKKRKQLRKKKKKRRKLNQEDARHIYFFGWCLVTMHW
jgi:hypothetical protein